MNVFIFAADMHCEDCGNAIRKDLIVEGLAPADPDDEHTYDSDDYPKGPYPDGGGEADYPGHCGSCGVFLMNPLTGDGYEYLRAQADMAGAIVRDEDGVDVERSAAKAQEDWDCTRRHGGSEDDDAPLAQWLRYYPEAWHPANGYMD